MLGSGAFSGVLTCGRPGALLGGLGLAVSGRLSSDPGMCKIADGPRDPGALLGRVGSGALSGRLTSLTTGLISGRTANGPNQPGALVGGL